MVIITLVAGVAALVAAVYLIVVSMRLVIFLLAHIFRYVGATISDAVRFLGAVPTALVLSLFVIGSIVLGRWSAVSHYSRAVKREILIAGRCIYGIVIGHPLRLFALQGLVEGLEDRIVEDVKRAPGADKPGKRTGQFEGYTIVGSLPGGGSGSKLYIAEPTPEKRQSLDNQSTVKAHGGCPDRVVIKAFTVGDGSSLPNMVRESRALEAARKLGLILEHSLTENRFYYVMAYVPGDDLGEVTRRIHAVRQGNSLDKKAIHAILGYTTDLLNTLDYYHRNGLWHKDVKPDNIIVHNGRAHLVDFGLVTPLASAMTLTTHGTEYFRDPELVRMALRGVKVNEVDGTKFDIYAAGAVLYFMLENTFPAHGGLSRMSLAHPDALAWIIRRAMTEYNKRYESVSLMLADLRVVADADDPYAVKPAALPSMRGEAVEAADSPSVSEQEKPEIAAFSMAASPVPPQQGKAPAAGEAAAETVSRRKPHIQVTSWFSGRYTAVPMGDPRRVAKHAVHELKVELDSAAERLREQIRRSARGFGQPAPNAAAGLGNMVTPAQRRASARKQIKAARARMKDRRRAARKHSYRVNRRRHNGVAGSVVRIGIAIVVIAGAAAILRPVADRYLEIRETYPVNDHSLPDPEAAPRPVAEKTVSSSSSVTTSGRMTVNMSDLRSGAITMKLQRSWEDACDDKWSKRRNRGYAFQLPALPRLAESAHAAPVLPVPVPPDDSPRFAGNLLLVNNHPAFALNSVKNLVKEQVNRLRENGFTIINNLELEAHVHKIVAENGNDLDRVVPEIRNFLQQHQKTPLAGIVWINGDSKDPAKAEIWLIINGEKEKGPRSRALRQFLSKSSPDVTYRLKMLPPPGDS